MNIYFYDKAKRKAVLSFWYFCLGVLVMFVSSSVWVNVGGVYSMATDGRVIQTNGELVANLGQSCGQALFALSVSGLLALFKGVIPKYIVFQCFVGFFFGWFLVDCVSVLFLNPYEQSVPKTVGVIISIIFSMIRYGYGRR